MTTANEKPWRVGRKVGRTIYDATDKLIGVMDTPELAALVTTAVNRYLSRAQPAEQPIGWYQDPNTIVLNSNNPMAGTDIHGMALYVRAQPDVAVDDAEYTQGFAYDGVVILKDGEPVTIDEVLAMLNARARGGK